MQNVLLIDDDIELVELLKEYIKLEGFDVDTAHDGEAGAQARAPLETSADGKFYPWCVRHFTLTLQVYPAVNGT